AHFPQYLPAGLNCPALAHISAAQAKLAPFRAALEQRGAPYVDSAQLLGAALALRDATRVFDAAPGGSPFRRFDFDWREDDLAKGTDRDLLDLLNLYWPDDRYPTAIVEGRGRGGACPRTPHILM